jgi:hypothetical protein
VHVELLKTKLNNNNNNNNNNNVWCIEGHCIYCRGESEEQNYFSICTQTASAHPSVIGRLTAEKALVNFAGCKVGG